MGAVLMEADASADACCWCYQLAAGLRSRGPSAQAPHASPLSPPPPHTVDQAGSLGATANAAAMSLMYAGQVEGENAGLAREYRCWALSQVGDRLRRVGWVRWWWWR